MGSECDHKATIRRVRFPRTASNRFRPVRVARRSGLVISSVVKPGVVTRPGPSAACHHVKASNRMEIMEGQRWFGFPSCSLHGGKHYPPMVHAGSIPARRFLGLIASAQASEFCFSPGLVGRGFNSQHGSVNMLVLSRKKFESIVIADMQIEVIVVEIQGDKVKLGIVAPESIAVHRREVYDAIERSKAKKLAEGG